MEGSENGFPGFYEGIRLVLEEALIGFLKGSVGDLIRFGV